MKKKKLISLEEKDIKKIEEIQLQNNLNFSQTITYLLNHYENRLSNHIVRNNENIEILNLYYNITKSTKFDEEKMTKIIDYIFNMTKKVEQIKIKKLKEIKQKKE